jgi:hypothetical protein
MPSAQAMSGQDPQDSERSDRSLGIIRDSE